jgi:hypothetical protein
MLHRRTLSLGVVLGLLVMGLFYGVTANRVVPGQSGASGASGSESPTQALAASSSSSSLVAATSSAVLSNVTSRTSSRSANATARDECFGANRVNDSVIPRVVKRLRMAVVQPVFTATPYSNHSVGTFYDFYQVYKNATGNVTTDLDMLSTNVSRGEGYNGGWGQSYWTYLFLSSKEARDCGIELGQNLQVLDDIAVSQGGLFYGSNGSARFDVVVVPFDEYVTLEEYLSYERFVANGGTLVMTGASNFLAMVDYNATSGMETLVRGHGWAFNGVSAWQDVFALWDKNSTNWVGSSHANCCAGRSYAGATANVLNAMGRALSIEFGKNVFPEYTSQEEDPVTNMTGTSVIATFQNTFSAGSFESRFLVASYVHQFRKGTVVCMCVQADLIMSSSKSAQYLLLLSIASAALHSAVSCSKSPEAVGSSLSCATTATTGRFGWRLDGVPGNRALNYSGRTPAEA